MMVNKKPAADKHSLEGCKGILEAEGWVESVCGTEVSALQIGACWTSILKLQQPPSQVWCLGGVEGVLGG